MGPRPWRSGEPAKGEAMKREKVLQWGRAPGGAERKFVLGRVHSLLRFNGAAPLEARRGSGR